MAPLGVNVNQLALALLARYFGTTPIFWINPQAMYDLDSAENGESTRIYREVQPMDVSRKSAIAAKSKA